MNYELAKELKDAGFPQNGDGNFVLHSFNEDEGGITSANDAYAPTLTELIEACGEEFESLDAIRDELVGWDWEAHTDGFCMVGSTPSEAVARLWLALNKKS